MSFLWLVEYELERCSNNRRHVLNGDACSVSVDVVAIQAESLVDDWLLCTFSLWIGPAIVLRLLAVSLRYSDVRISTVVRVINWYQSDHKLVQVQFVNLHLRKALIIWFCLLFTPNLNYLLLRKQSNSGFISYICAGWCAIKKPFKTNPIWKLSVFVTIKAFHQFCCEP